MRTEEARLVNVCQFVNPVSPCIARRLKIAARVASQAPTSSMRMKTRQSSSSTISPILANSRATSLPLSLNHLLNRLCALTSINSA